MLFIAQNAKHQHLLQMAYLPCMKILNAHHLADGFLLLRMANTTNL